MTLVAQVPALQVRKIEKIKKMIMETVRSSFCHLVWAHLTDSKLCSMLLTYSTLQWYRTDKVGSTGMLNK